MSREARPREARAVGASAGYVVSVKQDLALSRPSDERPIDVTLQASGEADLPEWLVLLASRIGEVSSEVTDVKDTLRAVLDVLTAVGSKFDNIDAKIAALGGDATSKSASAVADLAARVETIDSRLASALNHAADVENSVPAFCDEAQAASRAAESELRALRLRLDEIGQGRKDELKKSVDRLADLIATVTRLSSQQIDGIESHTKAMDRVIKALARSIEPIDSSKTKFAMLQSLNGSGDKPKTAAEPK